MNLFYPLYLLIHFIFSLSGLLSNFARQLRESFLEWQYFGTPERQLVRILDTVSTLTKKPSHLAIVIGIREKKINHDNICKLIVWTLACDIRLLTIFEARLSHSLDIESLSDKITKICDKFSRGSKIKRIEIFEEESVFEIDLTNKMWVKKEREKQGREYVTKEDLREKLPEEDKMRVVVISHKQSRLDFLEMIKRGGEYWRQSEEDYLFANEQVIRANLCGVDFQFPDPHLVLTFNSHNTLSGFLPFNIYASEIL